MLCELQIKIENFCSVQMTREIIWDWWQAFDFPLILCKKTSCGLQILTSTPRH